MPGRVAEREDDQDQENDEEEGSGSEEKAFSCKQVMLLVASFFMVGAVGAMAKTMLQEEYDTKIGPAQRALDEGYSDIPIIFTTLIFGTPVSEIVNLVCWHSFFFCQAFSPITLRSLATGAFHFSPLGRFCVLSPF